MVRDLCLLLDFKASGKGMLWALGQGLKREREIRAILPGDFLAAAPFPSFSRASSPFSTPFLFLAFFPLSLFPSLPSPF